MFGIKDAEMVREVVRRGGFRAAAQALNIVPSAVSARISLLEKRLGIRIFDREKRQVRLTAQGRRFLEQAERLISLRDKIAAELNPARGYAGTIRIGVAETVVQTLIPAMLKELRSRLPGMRIELSVDTSPELAAKLVQDQIDVAVLMPRSAPRESHVHPLRSYDMAWYAAPGLDIPRHTLEVKDLVQFPIVTFSKGTLPHLEVEQILSSPDLPAPLIHGSASLSTMVKLVRDGFGLGTIPNAIAREDVSDGSLRSVKTTGDAHLSPLDFAIACMSHQDRGIIDALVEIAGEVSFDQQK